MLRREMVEKLDADDYKRTLEQMREQHKFMEKQLKDMEEDIHKLERFEEQARRLRDNEVTNAKQERQKYIG